ncbi:MAG: nucleotide exchange factor GrpE [Candidatus Micrarchaeia archaeon]|jgi:molecular chaperone GrpE
MEHEKKTHTEKAANQGEQGLPGILNGGEKHDAPVEKGGEPDEKTQNEVERAFLELSDRLLRLTAEFDNYKKRTAKEKEALCLHSEARVMLRLLPIYEEIGLAEKEVGKLPDGEAKKGTLMVLGKLRKSFESDGLQPMALEGEKYDPFRHEVALREESDAPEGAIVRAIKQGYLYKGAVLQHAIVSVSAGKKAGADAPAERKGEEKKTEDKDD